MLEHWIRTLDLATQLAPDQSIGKLKEILMAAVKLPVPAKPAVPGKPTIPAKPAPVAAAKPAPAKPTPAAAPKPAVAKPAAAPSPAKPAAAAVPGKPAAAATKPAPVAAAKPAAPAWTGPTQKEWTDLLALFDAYSAALDGLNQRITALESGGAVTADPDTGEAVMDFDKASDDDIRNFVHQFNVDGMAAEVMQYDVNDLRNHLKGLQASPGFAGFGEVVNAPLEAAPAEVNVTVEQINAMNGTALKTLAAQIGLEDTSGTPKVLRARILEAFGHTEEAAPEAAAEGEAQLVEGETQLIVTHDGQQHAAVYIGPAQDGNVEEITVNAPSLHADGAIQIPLAICAYA